MMERNNMTDNVAEFENQSTIDAFLSALEQENYNKAENHFNNLLGDRIQDQLSQSKIAVAKSIYQTELDFTSSDDDDDDDDDEYDLDDAFDGVDLNLDDIETDEDDTYEV
jgi:hypothetical protein